MGAGTGGPPPVFDRPPLPPIPNNRPPYIMLPVSSRRNGRMHVVAVLGFLFLMLNTVAYQVRGVAQSVLMVMFLTRGSRTPPKPPAGDLNLGGTPPGPRRPSQGPWG